MGEGVTVNRFMRLVTGGIDKDLDVIDGNGSCVHGGMGGIMLSLLWIGRGSYGTWVHGGMIHGSYFKFNDIGRSLHTSCVEEGMGVP